VARRDNNTIFLPAFGPPPIQWQYNFQFFTRQQCNANSMAIQFPVFFSDNNAMAIFSWPFAHHQHNIKFFVICADKIYF
jgi:hypothetical protein